MSIPEANAFYIGALIALYERAVGFYGSLVNINAYDQPGVEAGKKAAGKLLQLQKQVRARLSAEGKTAEQIARSLDADPEDVFHLLRQQPDFEGCGDTHELHENRLADRGDDSSVFRAAGAHDLLACGCLLRSRGGGDRFGFTGTTTMVSDARVHPHRLRNAILGVAWVLFCRDREVGFPHGELLCVVACVHRSACSGDRRVEGNARKPDSRRI